VLSLVYQTEIFAPSPEAVKAALLGKKITGAKRKGKYMWLELDNHPACILIHLGMTGGIAIEGVGSAKYKR
jgi:formamidopyrimidine-DNA glycosylase